MPAVVRKLAIYAAVDGLVVQPLHQRVQRIKIVYESHRISTSTDPVSKEDASLECHGIVGLLTIAPASYLITISGRQQVAQIKGAPIYVITDVSLIPLTSQTEAKKAILQTKESLKRTLGGGDGVTSDSEGSEGEEEHATGHHDEPHDQASPISTESISDNVSAQKRPAGPQRSTSNVAEDVIGKKGQYGRFAERWFSKKGWTTERRKTLGMSADDNSKPGHVVDKMSGVGTAHPDSGSAEIAVEEGRSSSKEVERPAMVVPPNITNTLLPKLLRTTRMLLASHSFFYSYDMDITRRLGTLPAKASDIPLHESVDPLFFWNSHLAAPFIEGQHHSFIFPVIQGFVGQRSFSINKEAKDPAQTISKAAESTQDIIDAQESAKANESDSDFLITLISRRTIKRPGLRYLRRGVDDEGHTANSVETEQILSKASWSPSEKIYSFTQIRGSIPLFFSQSPYAFKPIPVLQHSVTTNEAAFKQHFVTIMKRYGQIQIVLLVDKNGGEAAIGQRYEQATKKFNEDRKSESEKLGFEWFDFHNICRGMKFENVGLLIDSVGGTLDKYGKTIEVAGNIQTKQTGVLRTNCMDCLDRTNVVQSACGQRALEEQLKAEGLAVDLRTDVTTQWFNTLWADNGDAISKQYSSTAALKGDFTRYRKRNYRGAINDLGLTLSRYYNNIVNDYFSQAAIDFLLGNVTAQVFEDFEDKMMSGDPGMSMQKVRENAINTSSKIVIEDSSEDLVSGWILLSPREPNTVKTLPLEEVVLLLTDAALYKVCFDWNSEKVASFEKVDLRSVSGIMKGTYITSTLASAQTDEQRNFGFIVKYHPGKEDIARVNTRTMSSAVGVEGAEDGSVEGVGRQNSSKEYSSFDLKILSFKALPARSSLTSEGQEEHTRTEQDLIGSICDEIQRATAGGGSGVADFVKDESIISLQEARKNTGLVEQWGHSLKLMVWG